MMQQAQIQFGFEADNIPLMIEAIPVNLDSIILIITKVEDPDELDTRFSKFSPYKENSPAEPLQLDGADNIIDIFQKICEAKMKGGSSRKQATISPVTHLKNSTKSATFFLSTVRADRFRLPVKHTLKNTENWSLKMHYSSLHSSDWCNAPKNQRTRHRRLLNMQYNKKTGIFASLFH